MSLVKQRHINLGLAGLLAIWAPLRLSDPDVEAPPAAGTVPVRPVRVAAPPALEASITRTPFLDPGLLAGSDSLDLANGADAASSLSSPPILLGTARGPRGKAVALVRGTSGSVETLARGETIDGWTLANVGQGEARFTQGEQSHVATLSQPNAPDTALASFSQDMPQ